MDKIVFFLKAIPFKIQRRENMKKKYIGMLYRAIVLVPLLKGFFFFIILILFISFVNLTVEYFMYFLSLSYQVGTYVLVLLSFVPSFMYWKNEYAVCRRRELE